MKQVKYAWWIFFALIIACFAIGYAYALEPVQDYVQCTYKPSQSDEVIKYCGTLKGKGSVSVRICGVNYVIDVVCE